MPQSRITATVAATLVILSAGYFVVERRNAAHANEHAMSGELVGYEVSSRNLTLRTDAGEARFVVADGATVHEGAKTITLDDLVSAGGARAKIWYRDLDGQRTAHEIRVSRVVHKQGG